MHVSVCMHVLGGLEECPRLFLKYRCSETAFGNNISVKLSIVTQVAIHMHIFVW